MKNKILSRVAIWAISHLDRPNRLSLFASIFHALIYLDGFTESQLMTFKDLTADNAVIVNDYLNLKRAGSDINIK